MKATEALSQARNAQGNKKQEKLAQIMRKIQAASEAGKTEISVANIDAPGVIEDLLEAGYTITPEQGEVYGAKFYTVSWAEAGDEENGNIMAPQRIQRRRTKGWRMPENTVYVGRGSRWGNPYKVGAQHPGIALAVVEPQRVCLALAGLSRVRDRADAVYRFSWLLAPVENRADLPAYPSLAEIKAELAGKNLACWCPLDTPCHADVLLEIANLFDGEAA